MVIDSDKTGINGIEFISFFWFNIFIKWWINIAFRNNKMKDNYLKFI